MTTMQNDKTSMSEEQLNTVAGGSTHIGNPKQLEASVAILGQANGMAQGALRRVEWQSISPVPNPTAVPNPSRVSLIDSVPFE